jgi:hypothetical protein
MIAHSKEQTQNTTAVKKKKKKEEEKINFMSGKGDMKRKLSNTIEKKPMLRRGFFNPIPKEPTTTWENLREKMNHIWKAGEKGFVEDLPLEILVRIFARHDNISNLCLVNKFFLGMTRAAAFRESFLYLNVCPIAYKFKCYRIIVPSLFGDLQLCDVVVDPIHWKRLLKSKRNSKTDMSLFGISTVVYINDYKCSLNDTNVMLYEGEWMSDLSEHGFKVPHGLGTCFSNSHFSISGTWDSGVFRTGNIYYNGKVFVNIERSSVVTHRARSLEGMVCYGTIRLDSIIDIVAMKEDERGGIPISFKGTWLYPFAFGIETHFCNYFAKTKFVDGVLMFKDEIHTGRFIEDVLDHGIIETISTGVTRVVTSDLQGTVNATTAMYVRRNAHNIRRRVFRGDLANLFNIIQQMNE